LGKARYFLIDDGSSGLRGNVARSKSGASGGENGITIIPVSPGQKRAPNSVGFVRQDLDCANQPSAPFQQLANCRAGAVLTPAGRGGITQYENPCAKRERHVKLSAVSFQLSARTAGLAAHC
jgi:hypothetical protein